jgi:hypothetical protein
MFAVFRIKTWIFESKKSQLDVNKHLYSYEGFVH